MTEAVKVTLDETTNLHKLLEDVLNENRNPTKGMAMTYAASTKIESEFEITIKDLKGRKLSSL